MPSSHYRKAFVAALLFSGLIGLTAPESILAANKMEEAKKATQLLKSGKSSKDKIVALTDLGALGRTSKSLVTDALPTMTEALKDKDSGVRAAAAEAVGKCDPEAATVDQLTDMVKNDKEESVKIAAAHGLAAAGSNAKSAVPTLREIQKASDKKSKLGKAAQEALRAINPKKN